MPCIDTVQGFYFYPAAYQPHTSVHSGFSAINAIYTAQTSKAFTGLCMGVSVDLTHSSARNTAATQADYTPPAPRWSVSQHRSTSSVYQIPTPRRTLHSLAQPPIIIRYIRVQGCAPVMDPCQTVQHTADHASPAGSASPPVQGQPGGLQFGTGQRSGRTGWHPPPGGQSSSKDAAGGAELLAALAASLFGLSPDSQ